MKVLAIIPARGGSKGIPKKNIQSVVGKPLIGHAILHAKKSKYINKIIVSTDDRKIAEIVSSYGAEIPFMRPKKLAKDDSSIIDVIKHTIDHIKAYDSYKPDVIVILQPTSPLRTTKLIDDSIEILKRSKASSVITVSKIKKHPFSSFWLKKGLLRPFKQDFTRYHQRQKYPDLYFPSGDVYAFWCKTLEKYGSIYGPKIKPMIVENDVALDIDTPFDLFIAEMKLKYWKKYKKRF